MMGNIFGQGKAASAFMGAAADGGDHYNGGEADGPTGSVVWHNAGGGAGEAGSAPAAYWFYIDSGGEADGWISSMSDNPLSALRAALDDAGVECSISPPGIISSIGGRSGSSSDIDMERLTLHGRCWYLWSWSASAPRSGEWVGSEDYLGRAYGRYFYIALACWEWDMKGLRPIVSKDPNSETLWKLGGPFARSCPPGMP